jgi:hypothetical protein
MAGTAESSGGIPCSARILSTRGTIGPDGARPRSLALCVTIFAQ